MSGRHTHRGLPANMGRQLFALLFTVLFCLPVTTHGQDSDDSVIHWAYASFLGTGWYKLDANREVYVLRAPLRWYFQDSSISESGQRQIGIEFHLPISFGLHKLDQIEDFVDVDNLGSISFNPGIEIEYPLSPRWYLRAYGHLGWGTEIESRERAIIFDAGIKSRYSFQNGRLNWAVLNEIFYAGYNESLGESDKLGGLMAGLDFSYPIGTGSMKSAGLLLDFDISYRWLKEPLTFVRTPTISDSIEDEWEIGLALAKADGPIKIWFMNFEHLGLSYRFNSDGSFKAIMVNFRSPFTR